MTTLALTVALIVLAALAAIQLLVAAGLPLGRFVWGGGHRVLPTPLRVGSALSVVAYGAFAALLLSRAGVLPGRDHGAVVWLTWVLLALLLLNTGTNLASRSPAERWTMAPACAVLAAATLVIALG